MKTIKVSKISLKDYNTLRDAGYRIEVVQVTTDAFQMADYKVAKQAASEYEAALKQEVFSKCNDLDKLAKIKAFKQAVNVAVEHRCSLCGKHSHN